MSTSRILWRHPQVDDVIVTSSTGVCALKLWPSFFAQRRWDSLSKFCEHVDIHITYTALKPPGCETLGSGDMETQSFDVRIFRALYSKILNRDLDAVSQFCRAGWSSADRYLRISISLPVAEISDVKVAIFGVFRVFDQLWRWISQNLELGFDWNFMERKNYSLAT